MVKTELIGDQFSSEWCHFSTTITLFSQVIHHNDKVKTKKPLFSFILSSLQTLTFNEGGTNTRTSPELLEEEVGGEQ